MKIRTFWKSSEMDAKDCLIVPQDADRIGLSVNDCEVEIDLTNLELIIRDSATQDEFLRFDCKIIEGVFE